MGGFRFKFIAVPVRIDLLGQRHVIQMIDGECHGD
jgi:hypothetical protein